MNDKDRKFFKLLNIVAGESSIEYSKDIPGCIIYDDFILSYVPVHIDFIKPFRGNIHACCQNGQVMREDVITVNKSGMIFTSLSYDRRYLSVAGDKGMVSWEDCKKLFEERG